MVNLYRYYLATHLLVINDLFTGGWTDMAYRRELNTLGFPRIIALLYGSNILLTILEVTHQVFTG